MDALRLVDEPANDAKYTAWVEQHPHGFIINAHKTGAVPMYWHRADCGHIQPDGETRFVGGDYIKACSLNPGACRVGKGTARGAEVLHVVS